jgi:hypothetical protein
MLIPLGILAASGASAGAFDFIAAATGTGSSTTITFSGIPQGYKQLQIRMTARDALASAGLSFFLIRFNGNTGNNYAWSSSYGAPTSVLSEQTSPDTRIQIRGAAVGNSAGSGIVGAALIDIMDYSSTTKTKSLSALSGGWATSSARNVALSGGFFNDTSAINSISIIGFNNWTNLTDVAIYGIKG